MLGLSRSGYYYEPIGESAENLHYMRLIDEQYFKTPFYGYPRMTIFLRRQGYWVNEKRVARLMRKMELRAVYPRPKTSNPGKGQKIFPYLLRGVAIERVNQVWSSDITFIPMLHGFLYLVAIMDWFSRFVLSWELSNSLERQFCLDALDRALAGFDKPEVFNTDQGSQFTSTDFTGEVIKNGIRMSMDGKGRVIDNIFLERLWWSVKYEEVYLKSYQDGQELWKSLKKYFEFYNYERPHESLGYMTPAEVYWKNPVIAASRPQ